MSLFAEVADAVKFFVDHEPIAQPRMKISGFHRWLPKTADGDPHPVIAYKKLIRLLAKAVMDSLKGTLWIDDSQIVDLRAVKMYAAGDEQAGVEIQVEELP